jgi:hypothetical protein
MAIPLTQLPRDVRRVAKGRLVAGMEAGLSWRQAAAAAGITTSEATAHRLRRRVQQDGDTALEDLRHGYPYKLPSATVTNTPTPPVMPSKPCCVNNLMCSLAWATSIRCEPHSGFATCVPARQKNHNRW